MKVIVTILLAVLLFSLSACGSSSSRSSSGDSTIHKASQTHNATKTKDTGSTKKNAPNSDHDTQKQSTMDENNRSKAISLVKKYLRKKNKLVEDKNHFVQFDGIVNHYIIVRYSTLLSGHSSTNGRYAVNVDTWKIVDVTDNINFLKNVTDGTSSQPNTATPKNIKNVKGFIPNEDQSFTVDLISWGSVKFASGKITGGNHIPTVFYLTKANGDILYSFNDAPFPYNVGVKAVSFQNVNKDGMKDIIIIVYDKDNAGKPIAAVWLRNPDKTFTCDIKFYQEINKSGSNNDIETVTKFLSEKS